MFEAISQYLADTPHLQSLRRHPVPSSSRRRKKLHTSRTPTPDAFRWGRHHLGIRGRLFLGIGGRDHFGIRGRIASEFASRAHIANAIRHIFKESDHLRYALLQCFHVMPMIEPLQSIS
ncbi:hypothetical protein GOL41_33660 [Sinorhizobium medicae]|nr:hypothetical protein [Sinorhizobium medicae]